MTSHAPRLLLAKDRTPARWKNGGGSAVEVASRPLDAGTDSFEWRVSIATVDEDADFSTYSGVQRYLMPLNPNGLTLEVDGDIREIGGFEATEFAGESSVRAVNVKAESLDLNLMVRRRAGVGRLTTHVVDGKANVFAAANEFAVIILLQPAFGLEYLDAVELQPDSDLNLEGSGPIAVARVFLDTTS